MDQLSDYVGVYAASDRAESARRLVEQVLSIRQRPPLMIEAPGGMGKSTLIAQFILTNGAAQHVQRFPFAYLDFDRPGLVAEEPVTLLLDAVRQFAVQFPHASEKAARLREEWQKKLREPGAAEKIPAGSKSFVRFRDRQWFYDSFAAFVFEIRPRQAPLLLVLDTFEEVQYRSKNFVEGVFEFLDAIQSRIPELRTVLAGRAGVKLDKYSVRTLNLPPFDREAAQAFLQKQGLTDVGLGFAIADQVGGTPLTLKLAAQLVRVAAEEAGPEGIRNLETGIIARIKGKSIEAQLYDRILDHIHDNDVKKLAHPGLILRKITKELIQRVLAGPCGVDVSKPGRASRLFDELSEEISLVEGGDPGVLVHRPDVRAVTLRMLIDDRKMRAVALAINKNAIDYYSKRPRSEDRAEELYHLLLFDLNRARVEPRADDVAALRMLVRSIDELPERSQAFLAARLDIERNDSIWKKADLPDWELRTARLVRESLASDNGRKALSYLQERKDRMPDSQLYGLELDALIQGAQLNTAARKADEYLSSKDIKSPALRRRLESSKARVTLLRMTAPSVRISPANDDVSKNLGLLAELAGTWQGRGFNLIARPDGLGGQPLFLELNQTNETLQITEIGSEIPNRGVAVADIELFGLTYLQKVSDAITGGALHIEPGMWLRLPDDPGSPVLENVSRMASIPHGSALLAEGRAIQVSPAGGTFNFDPVNTAPFKIGGPMPPGGTVSGFPEFDLAVPESAANPRTPFGNTPPIPLPADINGVPMQTIINDPTRLLQAAINGQNVKNMIVINIATVANPTGVKPVAGGGGGIENIPFLQTNANAAVMFATFWIETIEHPFRDFMQLQYVQTVILNFPIIRPGTAPVPFCWPHVSVATLRKTFGGQ
jgi:hypothetical protein